VRSAGRGFFFGGEAIVADAADLGSRDGDLDVAVRGNLLFKLLVKARFEFANLAAAETGDMDMVARAVGFVVVAVAAEVEEIELVDETFLFEEVDGSVDGDQMDFGIDFLCALEDLVDVEVLLGGVHDLQDDAALPREANTALAEGVLEMSGGFGGVDAFAARNTTGWGGSHGAKTSESVV